MKTIASNTGMKTTIEDEDKIRTKRIIVKLDAIGRMKTGNVITSLLVQDGFRDQTWGTKDESHRFANNNLDLGSEDLTRN